MCRAFVLLTLVCVDDVCTDVWMHNERSLNLVVNVFRSRRGNTNFFLIRAPTLSEWAKKVHIGLRVSLVTSRPRRRTRALCFVQSTLPFLFLPLHIAAEKGHEAVTKQLLAARCNVDLQANLVVEAQD